ncbi:Abi family protein [Legionella impletisoli]|nr:Abi family protein [Legionella impletisoli]
MATKKYAKPALTISEQIEFLSSQGLEILDEQLAHNILSTVSYYRFSSYLLPFKQRHQENNSRRFKDNISLDQAWKLYQFDRELRLLVSDAIERIEIAFRAAITNTTSVRLHPFWYTEREHFKKHKVRTTHHGLTRKKDFFDDFFKTVQNICQSKQEVFLQHYYQNYSEPEFPPIWMMIEALSFGAVSKMFDNIQSIEIRNEIASVFGQHTTVIESWMRTLTYTRNLCAHHSRLWNRWFVIPPVIPKFDPLKNHIKPDPDGNFRFQLIAFIIIRLLEKLSIQDNWKKQLFGLFEKYEEFPSWQMGFNSNWPEDPIWEYL